MGQSQPPEALAPTKFGQHLKSLRKAQQLTLAELAARSSVSPSAISKIENGVVSPTYDVLVKLTGGLNISFGRLFGDPRPEPAADTGFNGWQIIEKKGRSEKLETPNYSHEYLCTGLKKKAMIPALARLKARSIKEFGPLVHHDGEEFFYVLEGKVALHTSYYATVELEAGDCAYIDSTMGHAYVAASDAPATILCVCVGWEVKPYVIRR